MEKQEMIELSEMIATAVVSALKKENLVGNTVVNNISTGTGGKTEKAPKTAYQKTEQLLYNYVGFKKIVEEKQKEIVELRTYGVPQKSGSIVQYSPHCGTVGQIVLPEESVEQAVQSVEASVQGTVQAIAFVDKGMAALKRDPYYKVLEMRYFEGRTLEDIGVYFGCDHSTISRNKSRLVKELAMRLFPNDVVNEFMA
jgi:DNA-directed RNA polymerase specialized sigma subunit